MSTPEHILYEISYNTNECVGYDFECDEDGQLFQVACTCDCCTSKYVLQQVEAQNLGRTWRDFIKIQLNRFEEGEFSHE